MEENDSGDLLASSSTLSTSLDLADRRAYVADANGDQRSLGSRARAGVGVGIGGGGGGGANYAQGSGAVLAAAMLDRLHLPPSSPTAGRRRSMGNDDALTFNSEHVVGAVREAQDDEHYASASTEPSLAVFSGGTAMNMICRSLQNITTDVVYIMPISDNGGSTSEIVRVLGGPAIGDIRSRMVRLADDSSAEAKALSELLQYRLPLAADESAIRSEWFQLIDGSHRLWLNISEPYREIIRAFLLHFNTCVLTRSHEFNFANGSIGNFFFTGARLFFGSLEAAIFLFSGIARIPRRTEVIPIINLKFDGITIGAVLENGELIVGQNEISHPPPAPLVPSPVTENRSPTRHSKRNRNIVVDKSSSSLNLSAPIVKVFYVNSDGNEIKPQVNERVLETVARKRTVIYSCGSFYTSILPCLIVKSVGNAVAALKSAPKIMLLNGYPDRETRGMTAADYVRVLVDALNMSRDDPSGRRQQAYPACTYLTHLFYVRGTPIPVDLDVLHELQITPVEVQADPVQWAKDPTKPVYDDADLMRALKAVAR